VFIAFCGLNCAKPFSYLAKIVCQSFEELDQVLLAIESRRVGPVTLGTVTFVVARGHEEMTRVISQKSPKFVTPDTHGIQTLAQDTIGQLGAEAITSFNLLDTSLQTAVLVSLRDLQEQIKDRSWDDDTHERSFLPWSRSPARCLRVHVPEVCRAPSSIFLQQSRAP
jgi:hypothetical protein